METLKSLSRRVAVAEDVQSIVGTMKSLSAASIRQYEQAVKSLDEYNRSLRLGFQILFHPHNESRRRTRIPDSVTEVAVGDQTQRFGAIIFGSDQGLCGRFNESIVDHATEHMLATSRSVEQWSVISVGNRIHSELVDRGFDCFNQRSSPHSLAGITPFVQHLLALVQQWQEQNTFDAILVFHNKRGSSSTCLQKRLRLVPPDFRSLSLPRPGDARFEALPTFNMDSSDLFHALVRQYLFVALYRACAESLASENASRIASMQYAEKTINDRLGKLRSRLNKRRQNMITEELLDIITGYEASGA